MAIEDREGAWEVLSKENTRYHTAFRTAEKLTDDLPSGTTRRLLQRDEIAPIRSQSQGTHQPQWLSDLASVRSPLSQVEHHSGRRLEEKSDDSSWHFFYKTNKDATGNIFTAEHLQTMCELEKATLTNSGGTWQYITSPVPYVYGFPAGENPDVSKWDCSALSQAKIDAFIKTVVDSIKQNKTQSPFAKIVNPSFADTGITAYTRSIVTAKHANQDSWQETILKQLGAEYGFMRSAFQGDDDRFIKYKTLRVRFWYDAVKEMDKMIGPDFMMAILSVFLVYLIMYAYLRSYWIASWAMYQIVLALPIGSFFYRHIFMVDYFEFLHILIVYLVLGIGADDIFVFVDAFKHISEEYPIQSGESFSRENLHAVLKRTWLRAAGAIFNTSITTTIAFLSCSVSEVMPMRTCGWYASACIITVYLSTMIFAPAIVVIYHRRFQGKRCCCPALPEIPIVATVARQANPVETKSQLLQTFILKYYTPFMSTKFGPVRLGSLALFVLLLGVAIQGIFFTSQLTPPRKAEVWFPDSHMVLDLSEFISTNYYSPDYEDYAIIRIFWGIKELNLDDHDIYYPDKNIKVVYDSAFDLSTKEAQDHVLDVCQKLQTVTCDLEGCVNAGYGTLMMQIKKRTHSCFLADMKAELGGTLPQGAAFMPALKKFRTQKMQEKYHSDAVEADYKKMIGMIDGDLKYVGVSIRATMRNREPYEKGTKVRKLVQKYVDGWQASAPASMQSIKYDARGAFARFDLGSELIKGFYSGVAIAMPAAFMVLLLSTRNIIVSIYAVVSVAFIVCCVLGFCKSAMNWDMGIGEAIAGVIVIGYSVDFCVHLAHMYHESKHYGMMDRDSRCRFAVNNLGTTIFAGAVTTSGAGIPMFICFFYFFFKMALLITVTIMFSLLFSIGFFMSILWLIGPENSFGEIPNPFSKSAEVVPTAYKPDDQQPPSPRTEPPSTEVTVFDAASNSNGTAN